MSKKVLWIVVGILVIVAILIGRVIMNLDAIVASVIEDAGSKALQTEVSVNGVNIDIGAGSAGISGLTIANPPGYSNAKLFALEGIEVKLNLESLSQEVLIIDAVTISGATFSYEMKADGSNNMEDLLAGMDSDSASSAGESGGGDVSLIIDSLNFSGATVNVSAESDGAEEQQLSLPGISMAGVGRPNGATPEQIAEAVTSEVIGAVVKAAAKAGVEKMIDKEKEGLSDKLKDAFKKD